MTGDGSSFQWGTKAMAIFWICPICGHEAMDRDEEIWHKMHGHATRHRSETEMQKAAVDAMVMNDKQWAQSVCPNVK
jgi:uncharacterized protein (DUF2225 family)